VTTLNTYCPDSKTLTYAGVEYPFYIGNFADCRLHFALEILEFAAGKKTLQEVVENIKEYTEEK
jgi:hypothetical protein